MNTRQFLAHHPIFTAKEFAAIESKRVRGTVWNLLAYHLNEGNIGRIKRGLYYSVLPGQDPKNFPVDPYLIAGKATDDAVLAYHTALSLHGVAYSVFHQFYYLTEHVGARQFIFRDTRFIPLTYPRSLTTAGKQGFNVETTDRQGLDVRVTSLERTLVDVLDRIDLAGGVEEVWQSLGTITYLKLETVLNYALLLNNATTIAKVGFFLDQHRDKLMVKQAVLDKLRKYLPAQPHYMLRSKRTGITVPDWNLIVPAAILERTWEEPAFR